MVRLYLLKQLLVRAIFNKEFTVILKVLIQRTWLGSLESKLHLIKWPSSKQSETAGCQPPEGNDSSGGDLKVSEQRSPRLIHTAASDHTRQLEPDVPTQRWRHDDEQLAVSNTSGSGRWLSKLRCGAGSRFCQFFGLLLDTEDRPVNDGASSPTSATGKICKTGFGCWIFSADFS